MNLIFTDGSSSRKSGRYGWSMIGIINDKKIAALGHGEGSNQRGELTAIYYAMKSIPVGESLFIKTDSQYSIDCLGKFREMWEFNGMLNMMGQKIKHADLIIKMWDLYDNRKITLQHVRGHKGIPGNELADQIAHVARLWGENKYDKIIAIEKIKEIASLDIIAAID